MPECWKVDYYLANNPGAWTWYYNVESLIFQVMCVIAFGKAEVTTVWKDIVDPEGIKEIKEQLSDHVTNTNIMVSSFRLRRLGFVWKLIISLLS